ncbi:MAG: hypothetical protein IKO19_08125 [Candidatus Riflebacteria bacterium]|nr:hypothetical protein [Candidatus Riflebacteria bacterium]
MSNIRSLNRKLDAMLIMVIAVLILGIALSYNYYKSRRTTFSENSEYASDLLAYNLPSEAAQVLEANIRREPLSEKGLKMRKALAEICMNELNDFDKALGQLLYIKRFAPDSAIASGTDEKINYCLTRLGRVYDAERRNMLNEGINPIVNTVASDTVVQLGNKQAIGLNELKLRLSQIGISEKEITKENVTNILNQMTQELLLARAANRENIKKDPEVIAMLKKLENNVLMSVYLQKFVFKDVKGDDKEKRMQLLADEITKLSAKEELKINSDVLYKAFGFATDSAKIDTTKN